MVLLLLPQQQPQLLAALVSVVVQLLQLLRLRLVGQREPLGSALLLPPLPPRLQVSLSELQPLLLLLALLVQLSRLVLSPLPLVLLVPLLVLRLLPLLLRTLTRTRSAAPSNRF